MYHVTFSEKAVFEISKIDPGQRKLISKWIAKHLEGTDNPKAKGKALTGNLKGLWRYRVGDYRLIAEIHVDEIEIEIINAGHRSKIYS